MNSMPSVPDPKQMTLAEFARELCDLIDRLTPEEKEEWRRELVAFGMSEPLNASVH